MESDKEPVEMVNMMNQYNIKPENKDNRDKRIWKLLSTRKPNKQNNSKTDMKPKHQVSTCVTIQQPTRYTWEGEEL